MQCYDCACCLFLLVFAMQFVLGFVWSGLCSVCLCLFVCVFAVVCFVCFASSLRGLFGTQVFPD